MVRGEVRADGKPLIVLPDTIPLLSFIDLPGTFPWLSAWPFKTEALLALTPLLSATVCCNSLLSATVRGVLRLEEGNLICGLFLHDVSSSLLGARLRGAATRLWTWAHGRFCQREAKAKTQSQVHRKRHHERYTVKRNTGTCRPGQRDTGTQTDRHRQEREKERETCLCLFVVTTQRPGAHRDVHFK